MPTELGFRSTQPGFSGIEAVNEENPLPVVQAIRTPYTTFSYRAAGGPDLVRVSTGPCVLIGWAIYNHAATERLVRLYDKSSAAPVIATDNGLIRFRIGVPATATGAGSNFIMTEPGLLLPTGLGFSITTGMTSDTDATAATAGDVLVNLFWKPYP